VANTALLKPFEALQTRTSSPTAHFDAVDAFGIYAQQMRMGMTTHNGDAQDTGATEFEEQPTKGASTDARGTGDLQAALAAARAEAEQYKDKYLREYAERENFRKRQERVVQDRERRAKRDILLGVLDALDNVDRAVAHQETMDRESLQQVVRMLQWQLNELLKQEGLSVVPTVGEPFDPYVHEAIEQVASDAFDEGTVVEEVRKGYKQGDDTLRPARVKVSSGSGA
jgi:molecular chaperone GrpE